MDADFQKWLKELDVEVLEEEKEWLHTWLSLLTLAKTASQKTKTDHRHILNGLVGFYEKRAEALNIQVPSIKTLPEYFSFRDFVLEQEAHHSEVQLYKQRAQKLSLNIADLRPPYSVVALERYKKRVISGEQQLQEASALVARSRRIGRTDVSLERLKGDAVFRNELILELEAKEPVYDELDTLEQQLVQLGLEKGLTSEERDTWRRKGLEPLRARVKELQIVRTDLDSCEKRAKAMGWQLHYDNEKRLAFSQEDSNREVRKVEEQEKLYDDFIKAFGRYPQESWLKKISFPIPANEVERLQAQKDFHSKWNETFQNYREDIFFLLHRYLEPIPALITPEDVTRMLPSYQWALRQMRWIRILLFVPRLISITIVRTYRWLRRHPSFSLFLLSVLGWWGFKTGSDYIYYAQSYSISAQVSLKAEIEPMSKSFGAPFYQVRVPSGSYYMGCTLEQRPYCYASENREFAQIEHDLWVMQSEVTRGLFSEIMQTKSEEPAQFPMRSLPMKEIQNFITQLNKKLEYDCYVKSCWRLPTGAEWEYLARAGRSTVYAGSNNAQQVAWINKNDPEAVCLKKRNAYDLCDMSGNVWEWTSDDISYRVRGGSFLESKRNVRVSTIEKLNTAEGYNDVGFRLVRTIK